MQSTCQHAPAYAALLETMACNREYVRLLAAYLNECPCLVTPALIGELTASCAVSEREAFCAILSAAFGWEEETRERDRRLYQQYLLPSVRQLDAAIYQADPYYANVRIPDKRCGRWHLKMASYAPYEGFVAGPLSVDGQLREVPPTGYFAEGFSYPMVLEDGVEWMAIKPNEIETMRRPIEMAHGRVLAYGLGLGYFAYMAACKPAVEQVTVVERDPEVISLFKTEILPQFAEKEKIQVVQADAFAFAGSRQADGFDYVFCDLWHDASDGLPLYIQMRKIEEARGDGPYVYWVEDMLLSHLRTMVFDGLTGKDSPRVESPAAMYDMLRDPYLRRLAPDLRREEGRK